MVGTVGETHAVELFHGEHIALFARYSLIEKRQRHIFYRILIAYKIERLKYKPYKAVAQFGCTVFTQILDKSSVEHIIS